jgi:hypothetical protein
VIESVLRARVIPGKTILDRLDAAAARAIPLIARRISMRKLNEQETHTVAGGPSLIISPKAEETAPVATTPPADSTSSSSTSGNG